jgi:hypothetical protein
MRTRFQWATAMSLLIACVLVNARVDAQSTTTQITVTGGVATDQRGVRSNALTLAPSVTVEPRHNMAFQLGGNATRFATDFSLGLGASLNARDQIGRFAALTVSASAGGSRLNGASSATFAQADLVPALELSLWRVSLFGGLRAATGMMTEESRSPGLPVGGPPPTSVTSQRAGVGPVYGGVVTLGNAATTLRLGAREERLRIADAVLPERTLSAALSVALTPIASLEIGAGRYDANRLLGTPSGDYVSAGISLRFGGSAREPSLPEARGTRPQPAGATRLSIRAPDARRVEIAGDFNEWTPSAATRADNGVWYADLRIPPGQYRYAFRVNGSEWRVPDGATAVDDGFGGKSAWVTVSQPPRSR